MTFRTAAAAASLALGLAFAASPASAAQVGVLKCSVAGGIGFVFGSSKDLTCVFERSDGGPNDRYVGSISRFGIDIGVTTKSEVIWGVIAAAPPGPKGLAGTYVGASTEATAGVGVGANVLVGGFNKSFSLQPLSVSGQEGADIALGIAGLELRAPQ
jgi:hypothetical protein